MCLFFLWPNGSNDASVGDFAVFGDLIFSAEKTCISASGHACANALKQAAKFVRKGAGPNRFLVGLNEVTVLLNLSSDWVGDGVGEVGGRKYGGVG